MVMYAVIIAIVFHFNVVVVAFLVSGILAIVVLVNLLVVDAFSFCCLNYLIILFIVAAILFVFHCCCGCGCGCSYCCCCYFVFFGCFIG